MCCVVMLVNKHGSAIFLKKKKYKVEGEEKWQKIEEQEREEGRWRVGSARKDEDKTGSRYFWLLAGLILIRIVSF